MHPENDLRPGVVYERTRDLDDLPTDLRLPNAAWAVLFAVTGEHTAAQIGEHCGLSAERRDHAFGALLAHDLLAERPVTAGEYLRAAATLGDDTPHDLATFLASVARPRVGGVAVAQRTAPPASEATHSGTLRTVPKPTADKTGDVHVTRRISAAEVQRAVDAPTGASDVGFEPLNEPTGEVETVASTPPPTPTPPSTLPSTSGPKPPPIVSPASVTPSGPATPVAEPATRIPSPEPAEPAEPPKPEERRLSLRSLMQFILDRAPDLNAGQLDVYRVFIRVDTKLLKRNGITTLRFEEDRLVGDHELQQAIRSSLERTLGLTMPQTVFV